ncbi:hypothetical protein [Rahnella laticis]|uniref:hypothetical protein n=1 Tax=Rahnella laticis TaxID=2787622 RepID=UPI0018A32C4F|nr:hypothetical protein [Rahnella laticis]MBF7997626.1 hypothetical protein [Rahnella laticis]
MNKNLFLSTCYIVALGLFSAESLATPLPKGTDYPVTHLYKGSRSVQVDRSDEFTNSFRTRFKDAMQGPVVFAGEYAQAEWGCGGSGCHTVAFINVRTGRALPTSFSAYDAGDEEPKTIGEEVLYINKTSKLLVTYDTHAESGKHFYNYYVLENRDLKLIQKAPDTGSE